MPKSPSDQRNIDELAANQESYKQEILKVIANYRKDSSERKTTAAYYKERLRRLTAAWELFETLDSEIKLLPESPTDHPYFTTRCYEKTQQVYEEYQAYFTRMIVLRQKEENTEWEKSTKQNNPVGEQSQNGKSNTKVTGSSSSLAKGDYTQSEMRTDGSSETIRLIRRQRAIIESLRRLITSLNNLDQTEYPKYFYELKIKLINQQWAQLEEHYHTMWELTEDPSSMGYDINEYIEIEERVQDCLVLLSSKLDEQLQVPGSAVAPTHTMINLPKITLPKFNGDYASWRQFHDLFSQMVHNQPMSNCQKMWYLKTNLIGEAEKLVRHFTLSDQNYMAAWKMLQERYENPRLLVASLVNKLLTQSSHVAESVSATAIKTLHDTTQECLLGLENLGVSTSNWDPLLLHILLKKVDKTTHALYEQSLQNPKELQSLQGFLSFLEIRFQSLEALGSKLKCYDDQTRRHGIVKSLTSVMKTVVKCAKCKGPHRLFQCQEFIQMLPEARTKFICKNGLCLNCFRTGHNASNCTLRGCTKCNKKHNTLVHTEPQPEVSKKLTRSTSEIPAPKVLVSSTDRSAEQPLALATISDEFPRTYVLLSTARVKLISNSGKEIECRAILDSGSQVNLITERAVKKLGLSPTYNPISIHGVGNGKQNTAKRINVTMQSRINKFTARLEAFVMTSIISPQPAQAINTATWAIPCNIQLADPLFNEPNRIDLLLGAEFYHQLLSIGQIRLGKDLPTLQNTVFGWVVAGKINHASSISATCGICTEEGQLNKIIEKFWKIEESEETNRNNFTPAEQRCDTHFNQTVQIHGDGRFVVRLPFSDDPSVLGHSKEIALRRLISLEKRLARQPDVKQQYADFMKEYSELGHMEEVDINSLPTPHYFLPHHCVIKPDSSTTKLRVVFDASAKTSSNVSLNEILHAGPTIQDDIFSILLRFRLPRFVFTADIQKMYRQIWVHEKDRKYQLILWRDNPNEVVKCYQLRTVTYGTTSAPYLAIKCLKKLALLKASEYPLGAKALQDDFYVDDVMTGADSIITTHEIQMQLIKLLQDAGFKLRKWCANHPKLMQNIPPEDQEVQLDFTD